MTQTVAVIVQARMSSTRLPGKVLAPLAGKPSICRLMERVSAVSRADHCLVATSIDSSDDPVANACAEAGISCVRGSLDDVLGRYERAAETVAADVVVRVTGDCPLHDPAVIDSVIAVFGERVDYASNVDVRTYPDGLDTEVFSRDMLREAATEATTASDREHVTGWIRRHARRINLAQEQDLSDLRWTLDYPADYQSIAAIYDELQIEGEPFDRTDIYELLMRRPEMIRVHPDTPPSDDHVRELVARLERQLAADRATS